MILVKFTGGVGLNGGCGMARRVRYVSWFWDLRGSMEVNFEDCFS